jgi:hypothetical protein
MSFTVRGRCKDGELARRRSTPEAALRKAQELTKTGGYDVHIVTPRGGCRPVSDLNGLV